MEAYRIVRGNSVRMHALVRRVELGRDTGRVADFDMRQCDRVSVWLVGGWGDGRALEHRIAGEKGSELVFTIPGDLDCGRYGVRISWEQDGMPMASVERRLIGIVDHNSQTRLPLGHVETERAGLFVVSWWMETVYSEVCRITYSLRNVTVSNPAETVRGGESYETEIAADEGYSVGGVRVVMDGEDVTAATYDPNTHVVSIPSCHGGITIIAANSETDKIMRILDNLTYIGEADASGEEAR